MARIPALHPRLATLAPRVPRLPKEQDGFYRSPEWRGLMRRIKRERGERCEECGVVGVRILGDHVVERRDGGADLDPDNIRLLCTGCHNRKTARARADRSRR